MARALIRNRKALNRNLPTRPYVHRRPVVLCSKQQLRWTVPQRNDMISIETTRERERERETVKSGENG